MDRNTLIAQALNLHQRGQLSQAADLYDQILSLEPGNFAALQFLGVLRGQLGRNAEGTKLLEAALAIQPGHFGALANYGQVLMGSGDHVGALAAFDKALSAKPDFFEALYNRGVALAELKRFSEAVTSYDKALALHPGNVACLYNRAIALAALDRHDDALADYDKALDIQPNFAAAWDNRGNVLRNMGRPAAALESYEKALQLAPQDSRAWYNRANALADLQRFEEALAGYDRALSFQPVFFEALRSRAVALLALNRFDEALGGLDQALAVHPGHVPTLLHRAILLQEMGQAARALADYDKAIAAEPGNARAWNGRGSALHALKRAPEALAHFDKALALDPKLADALANRANLRWAERGDHAGAVADLKAALAANPDQPFARGELLHLKMHGADWEDFDREVDAIDQAVRQGQRVVRPFVYQAISQSPADLQACSRTFAASLFSPAPQPLSFAHHHQKIRIGYVSGEFREQATAYLMAGLYERHDRQKFEIIAIDNGGGDASPMRQRLEAGFDRFLYIAHMSDDEAATRIRREEIDILVNLNGYFGAPRMGVFARRAAPIQVNYLGFPATLGAACIDYIIADEIVIPPDDRRFYDEQVVYLPPSYQANDNKRAIAQDMPSRADLGLPAQGFVFCNFNQSYKVTPSIFASWMRILNAVEDSVLWLLSGRPPLEANLAEAAQRHGIAPHRLVFAPSLPPDRHLARLKQADLFLDTLPYNAHTTASDALWAGVPLLTCRGTAFPGRVAASLLTAAGMPELVMESMADYEARAIALGCDPKVVARLKEKLARNRLNCPLFDTDRFRKDIEMAYTTMWQAWQRGETPKGFAVEPTLAAGY